MAIAVCACALMFGCDRYRETAAIGQWLGDRTALEAAYAAAPASAPAPTDDKAKPYLVKYPAAARTIAMRAMLLLIQQNEGTNPNSLGVSPYRVWYGHNVYKGDFVTFPDQCFWIATGKFADDCIGRTTKTSAFGAYQFLPTTWDSVIARLVAADGKLYTQDPNTKKAIGEAAPLNQDLVATANFALVGGYKHLMKSVSVTQVGLIAIDRGEFNQAVWAAAIEWASFPKEDGSSIGADFGGQEAISLDTTWHRYLVLLEQQQAQIIPGSASALGLQSNAASPQLSAKIPAALLQPMHVGDTIAGFPVTDVLRIRTSNPETGLAIAGCNPGKPTLPPCRAHKGFDIGTPVGTPLVAPIAATVACANDYGRAGKYAVFTLKSNPRASFALMHLQDCQPGEYAVGDRFATTGDGGTGPHLHLEGWLDANYYVYPAIWAWGFLKGRLTVEALEIVGMLVSSFL